MYEGVVQVVRGRFYIVNHYLSYGYRLLAVMSSTEPRKHPGGPQQWYVHRGVEYVLGRDAETPIAPLMPRPRQQRATAVQEDGSQGAQDAEVVDAEQVTP